MKIKKITSEIKFYFLTTFRKITIGGFVNQLIKEFWPEEESKQNNNSHMTARTQ